MPDAPPTASDLGLTPEQAAIYDNAIKNNVPVQVTTTGDGLGNTSTGVRATNGNVDVSNHTLRDKNGNIVGSVERTPEGSTITRDGNGNVTGVREPQKLPEEIPLPDESQVLPPDPNESGEDNPWPPENRQPPTEQPQTPPDSEPKPPGDGDEPSNSDSGPEGECTNCGPQEPETSMWDDLWSFAKDVGSFALGVVEAVLEAVPYVLGFAAAAAALVAGFAALGWSVAVAGAIITGVALGLLVIGFLGLGSQIIGLIGNWSKLGRSEILRELGNITANIVMLGMAARGVAKGFKGLQELGNKPAPVPEKPGAIENKPSESPGKPGENQPKPAEPLGRPGKTNYPEKFSEIKTPADVPEVYRNDPRFGDLIKDPAHNGKVTPGTIREAMGGLEAESQGVVKGPISRSLDPKADYVEVDGRPFDMKTPPSRPGDPNHISNIVESIETKVGQTVTNPVTGQPQPVNKVVVDTTYLTVGEEAALKNAVAKNPNLQDASVEFIKVRF